MASMKNTKSSEERILRQFLKEKGLRRTFRTWKRLRRVRKTTFEKIIKTPDGEGRRIKVQVTREGIKSKRFYFRDSRTLKILSVSKAKGLKTALRLFEGKNKRDISINNKIVDVILQDSRRRGVKLSKTRSALSTDNDKVIYTENLSIGRRRKILITNKGRKGQVGHVVARIRFMKKSRSDRIVKIRSSGGFILTSNEQIGAALNECIDFGIAKIDFSPDGYDILEYWFEYWTDTDIER